MSISLPIPHLTRQTFEEEFLGGPVIRMNLEATKGQENEHAEIDAIVAAALLEEPILLSCRVAADAEESISQLQAHGFRQVEILVTLERTLNTSGSVGVDVEHAVAEDEDACREIARTAFSYDRFHADPQISDLAADRLKSAWVRNSLRGRADTCLVIRYDDETAGFISCLLTDDFAIIDLIAVSEKFRGHGLGGKLVQGSLAYYGGRKPVIRVGTQFENESSIRMYENAGFREVNRQATLHLLPHGGEAE